MKRAKAKKIDSAESWRVDCAVLVERLGGSVTITEEEVNALSNAELELGVDSSDPSNRKVTITVHPKPLIHTLN